MKTINHLKVLFLAGLVFASGLSGQEAIAAPRALDISDRPLFVQNRVRPSFIMAVDDSGSMQWDILSTNQDGQLIWGRDTATSINWGFFRDNGILRSSTSHGGSGSWQELFPIYNRGERRFTVPPIPAFGFARSPEFNPSYFDPAITYRPWLNYDGTPFESMDTPAEWESMKVDPRHADATAVRYDLTRTIRDRSDSNDTEAGAYQILVYNRSLHTGFVLRRGWEIRRNENNASCPGLLNPAVINSSWQTIDADTVLTGACTQQVRVRIPNQIDTPAIGINSSNNNVGAISELFHVKANMVIPRGTEYFVRQPCGGLGSVLDTSTVGAWTTTPVDVTLSEALGCAGDGAITGAASTAQSYGDRNWRAGFSYFAPTYYLTTNTSPDGNITPTQFTNLAGGPRAGTVPGNGTLYRYEIRPDNYSSPADYQRAMTNFANWFLYYRNRNLAMVAAMTHSLRDVEFMRIGFFKINETSNGTNYTADINPVVMHDMGDFSNNTSVAGRRRLYENHLIPLTAAGSTPNGWAVNQLGLQFERAAGTSDPTSPPPVVNACQFNAGMLFTDGYANAGRPETFGNVDSDPPFHGVPPFNDNRVDTLADIAAYYYKNNLRPDLTPGLVPTPGCGGSNPDPWLDCNRNPHMNFYGITLGASGEYFGVTYQQDPDTFQITPDVYIPANKPAWKAWADSSRSAVDDLWHATLNARGKFINATSPERITRAMNDILTAVNDRASVSGGTAASGTRREDGFLAYVPHYDPKDWTGNLKAHRLEGQHGHVGATIWDAAALLAARNVNSRRIYFVDDSGAVQAFTADASLPDKTIAALDRAVSELCPSNACNRNDLIEYLRGDHSKEQVFNGPFRSRAARIGDILGSQPEVLSKASYGYSSLPAAMGGSSYHTFLTTTKKDRTPLVFVGSNDGMLHAFNALTGEEVWALIPNSVLVDNLNDNGTAIDSGRSTFADLVRPGYEHRYFVDGSPRQGDAYFSSGWKTVLAAPLGAGGNSMLVLDVTNGASDTTPTLIAEVKHADLGYAMDRPRVVPLKDGSWRALFGNGFNTDNHTAFLVSVDVRDGTLERHATGSAGDGEFDDPNGMAGGVAAADDDADGLADAIYAGDYKGNLWKFPVTASGITDATIPLFQARDSDNVVQHITGGVDVMTHPRHGQIVYFGTGRYLLNADRGLPSPPDVPQVQAFYAVWDGDWPSPGSAAAPSTTITRSQLQGQTLGAPTTVNGITTRTTTDNQLDWGSLKGWYLNLAGGGERVVGVPTAALGRVIFTTFQPNPDSDECAASGINWLIAVNAGTGVGSLGGNPHDGTGAIRLPDTSSGGGPVATPPLVVTPPTSCDPLTDPDCRPPEPDPDDDERVTPAGAPLCNNDIGILLADGVFTFTQLTCGRQSWRQIQ